MPLFVRYLAHFEDLICNFNSVASVKAFRLPSSQKNRIINPAEFRASTGDARRRIEIFVPEVEASSRSASEHFGRPRSDGKFTEIVHI